MIELFPYQKEGALWLTQMKQALLADEMGLGKTVQAIAAADAIQAKRICVICPAIARVNWLREFKKFSPGREIQILQKLTKTWPENSLIVSYEGALSVLEPGKFDLLILDEAHYLKSKDAKRTLSILGKKGLVRNAKRTWALSGTPAPNHAGELWPLLFTFGATELKYTPFIEKFCDAFHGPYGLQVSGTKHKAIPELKKILKPILLRRKKEDVMQELPPIFLSHHLVEPGVVDLEMETSFAQYCFPINRVKELEEKLKQEARLVEDVCKLSVDRKVEISALEALAGSVSTLRRYTGLQKVESVAKLIEDELENKAYEKIVLFAIHRDVIEGLRVRLSRFGAVTLYGGHTPEKKQKHVDKFQKNPRCRVMIANIQTAGTAINLTASSQVAFIEQSWVVGENAQAMMRCHRIGQTQTVFVRFFGLANSIDERISQVLKRKTKDLTKIFDDVD